MSVYVCMCESKQGFFFPALFWLVVHMGKIKITVVSSKTGPPSSGQIKAAKSRPQLPSFPVSGDSHHSAQGPTLLKLIFIQRTGLLCVYFTAFFFC